MPSNGEKETGPSTDTSPSSKFAVSSSEALYQRKTFECDQCEYVATLECYLARHKRMHTKEKPYKCDQCDYRAAQPGTLGRHKFWHTGQKPFKCEKCSFITNRKSSLRLHVQVHADRSKLKCDMCAYSSMWPNNLKTHKKKVHPNGQHWGYVPQTKVLKCQEENLSGSDHLADSYYEVSDGHTLMVCGEQVYEIDRREYNETSCDVIYVLNEKTNTLEEINESSSAGNSSENGFICSEDVDQSEFESCDVLHNHGDHDSDLGCVLSFKNEIIIEEIQGGQCDGDEELNTHSENEWVPQGSESSLLVFEKFGGEVQQVNESSDFSENVDSNCTTDEDTYECDLCTFSTGELNHLRAHVLTHVETESPDIRGEASTNDTNERNTTSSGEIHQCDLCGYKTFEFNLIRKHILLHTGKNPFTCYLCSFETSKAKDLTRHILSHPSFKFYECHHCNFKTPMLKMLRRHIARIHFPDRATKCKICGHQFESSNALKDHLVIHSLEKPFECDQCDYKTALLDTLKLHHKLKHSGKRFKCDQCDYESTRAATVKLHKVKHTQKKNYQCTKCDYKSAWQSSLKQHLLRHADKERGLYQCELCNFKTTWPGNLKSHMKFLHKIIVSNENMVSREDNS